MTAAMTQREQDEHAGACAVVRSALSALRLSGLSDENIRLAKWQLERWLEKNDERWTQ